MTLHPPGWTTATVADLGAADEQAVLTGPFGSHLRSSEFAASGVPVLTIGCLTEAGVVLDKAMHLPVSKAEPLARYRLREGDMLFSRMASVGRAGFVTAELAGTLFNYHIMRLRLDSSAYLPHLFLAFVRGAPQVRQYLEDVNHGATRDGINTEQLLAMPVLVPPLNEQRRIVAKLDAVFKQTRAAKARLERLPALLDKLKRSILAAAFRGDLTKDWRAAHPDVEPASVLLDRIRTERRRRWEESLRAKGKDPAKATYDDAVTDVDALPALPRGWTWATMRELAADERYALAIGPFGSSLKVEHYREHGVPLVFVRHVRARNYVDLKPAFIAVDKARELAAHQVVEGDVLITKMGDPPGDADVYPSGLPPAVVTADVIKITVERRLASPRFLATALYSPTVRVQVLDAAQGVAQQKMSLDRFEGILVPLPPPEEQAAMLAVVSDVMSALEMLSERGRRCAVRARALEQAALAKAFRGELVPQDPTDEPASVLLERIRAARAAEPERPRRGRTARVANAAPPASPPAAHNATAESASTADPLDLVVAAFQQGEARQSAAAIAAATGLTRAAVKQALADLIAAGQVRVHGKARGTSYEWIA